MRIGPAPDFDRIRSAKYEEGCPGMRRDDVSALHCLQDGQMPHAPYGESMPTALQESSEDRFRAIFGTGRSSGVEQLSQDGGVASAARPRVLPGDRALVINVAPASPPDKPRKMPRFLAPTPKGQSFRALLLRTGDADFSGKVWGASPVIAFYLPDEDDNGNEPIRYVGTSTFLKYAGDDDGWFDMGNPTKYIIDAKGTERDPHYLDPDGTAQVCAWILSQPDAEYLALSKIGHGDMTS